MGLKAIRRMVAEVTQPGVRAKGPESAVGRAQADGLDWRCDGSGSWVRLKVPVRG